jgi:hypothetical protein
MERSTWIFLGYLHENDYCEWSPFHCCMNPSRNFLDIYQETWRTFLTIRYSLWDSKELQNDNDGSILKFMKNFIKIAANLKNFFVTTLDTHISWREYFVKNFLKLANTSYFTRWNHKAFLWYFINRKDSLLRIIQCLRVFSQK